MTIFHDDIRIWNAKLYGSQSIPKDDHIRSVNTKCRRYKRSRLSRRDAPTFSIDWKTVCILEAIFQLKSCSRYLTLETPSAENSQWNEVTRHIKGKTMFKVLHFVELNTSLALSFIGLCNFQMFQWWLLIGFIEIISLNFLRFHFSRNRHAIHNLDGVSK